MRLDDLDCVDEGAGAFAKHGLEGRPEGYVSFLVISVYRLWFDIMELRRGKLEQKRGSARRTYIISQ